ncbi:dihydrolipoyl dehydrogenase [Rickettsiaceae bacterium]|nr:dihydrolipoyl dehydrogenase [Rickettsiaceae bacterium]
MEEKNFDVVVIGGGPGGYVAAIRLAQLGQKTALIEREHLGGICLNWGCIPTKSLLKSAELYQKIKNSEEYGISVKDVKFDIGKIVDRSRDVSKKLTSGIAGLMKKNKITVIEGEAKLEGGKTISVSSKNDDKKTSIKAKNIIVATGARARILKGFEPNEKNIWSYKEALVPKSLPESMTIVGSGAIGIEFASFYNALGVDVTVLEAADRILSAEDHEISKMAQKSFESQGIKFKTGVKLLSQKTNNNDVTVSFEHSDKEQSLKSEILLMAVGIVGNTENIGIDNTKIKLDRGHIVTNDLMQTEEEGVYAIGDVAGTPWLAHKASHEGVIAAEVISGSKPHKIKKNNIPACTYSSPQIASVGLTEEAAKAAKHDIRIGRFPFYANGKALILGSGDGIIKTIFDAKTGEILGAHMIGCDVTELIGGYVVAKELEGTELELMNSIFPHPTLSEMMHESVLQAYGRQIHI